MRIRGRLLLSYVILIALFTAAAGILAPRIAERQLVSAERVRLKEQVTALAERIRSRSSRTPGLPQYLADLMDSIMTDETVLIVDPLGRIQFSTNPALRGRSLHRRGELLSGAVGELEGVGEVIMASAAIPSNDGRTDAWQVLMIRRLSIIREVARSVSFSVLIVLLVGLIASSLLAGWLSQSMVTRLHATGDAARALAEGDLSRRAPEHGSDEIAELAGHFNHMAERIQALVDGLRKSEGARKELLIMVSHELRTPLTSINGFAEALRDGVVQDGERRQRFYEIIASESARMNRMITELFDVAKLDAGQADLNLQSMSVTRWLVEFAESFQAGQTSLEVLMEPEAESARIYGDRDRLDQVLANLTANAVRFTPAGGKVLLQSALSGEDVVISVTDEGPGLTPEEAERVFDRFYQGRNQGTAHKGAGLGLSIVQSLVTAHGGTVGVNSTPGCGATFWFRLKRLQA